MPRRTLNDTNPHNISAIARSKHAGNSRALKKALYFFGGVIWLGFIRPTAAASQCWCDFPADPFSACFGHTTKVVDATISTTRDYASICRIDHPISECFPDRIRAGGCFFVDGVMQPGSCTASADGGAIPSNLPDGPHVAAQECAIGAAPGGSGVERVRKTFNFKVDNTPPEVLSVSAPSCDTADDPSAAGCPAFNRNASIPLSGSLSDGSGVGVSSVIFAQSAGAPLVVSGDIRGSKSVPTSGGWQVEISSADPLLFGFKDSSGTNHVYFSVIGIDKLGNHGGTGPIGDPLKFATTEYVWPVHIHTWRSDE